MEPQINTLEALEVLDKVEAINRAGENFENYLDPRSAALACRHFSSGQQEFFSALIIRHLEKVNP
jgi:hypothetical protein